MSAVESTQSTAARGAQRGDSTIAIRLSPQALEAPQKAAPEHAAVVKLSPEARAHANQNSAPSKASEHANNAAFGANEQKLNALEIPDKTSAEQSSPKIEKELTKEEQRRVQKLQRRDREIRSHEQAHLNALGPYRRGGASFSYQNGPDGKQYAVHGKVAADVSPGATPRQSIEKAQRVKRSATAPVTPSAGDRRMIAQATRLEMSAKQQASEETLKKVAGSRIKSADESSTSPIEKPDPQEAVEDAGLEMTRILFGGGVVSMG